ncbi:MAG: type II toxin-antitoxin system VapC family toxin [Gemmatimonadaceae bacterium]
MIARKYVIDTNCYIDASHDREFGESLIAFAIRVAPSLYVSAVVLVELYAGLRTARDRALMDRNFTHLSWSFHRIVTPSAAAWRVLGLMLSDLRADSVVASMLVRRSFAFDVLLACSCREIGATLVTRNTRDFARISEVVGVDIVAPFVA